MSLDKTKELADLMTARQLALQRLNARQYRDLREVYIGIADSIEAKLNRAKPLTEIGKRRLEQQIKELNQSVRLISPDLVDLAEMEVAYSHKSMLAVGVDATLPSNSAIKAIAGAALVQGEGINDWFKDLEFDLQRAVGRQVRIGVAAGLTNQEITKSLIGDWSSRAGSKGSEPLKLSLRGATTLVRTATAQIASDARKSVYEANDDLIYGYEHLSTLDSRTSTQCGARDGLKWRKDGTPIDHSLPMIFPPLHPNCRSQLIPILAVDMATTRASDLAQESASTTFEEFMDKRGDAFAEEVLGKGRYELYKAKNLSLTDLLDPQGLKPLTLEELQDKFG